MAEDLLARLSEFSAEDKTPRIVQAIFKVVPGSPEMPAYPALPSVVAALGGSGADVAAATAHIQDESVQDVLWMSGLIDTGDRGYAVLTGLSSAMSLFFGSNKAAALETDTQQRNDAVLKAIAISYMAWKAFDGSIVDRAKAFAACPSGKAILSYYAAIEIALPFADNAVVAGGETLSSLMDKYGAAQLQKFSQLTGGKNTDGVAGALSALTGPIESAIATVRPHAAKIAEVAKNNLPGALATGDKVAGVLAGVADVLPVYRYLGARLAAESAVIKARGGAGLIA